MNNDIEKLQKLITDFRDARDWKQFHNPKDMILSLILETSELAEHLQWKTEAEIGEYLTVHKGDFAEELADVFYWTLLIANDFEIDLKAAMEDKMRKNNAKYDVKKAKGNHKKYTEL